MPSHPEISYVEVTLVGFLGGCRALSYKVKLVGQTRELRLGRQNVV